MKTSLKATYLASALLCCSTVAQSDTVYVTSAVNNIVERYRSSGHGTVFANFGLSNPEGIAYRKGFFYVANFNNNTIGKFKPDGYGTLFASSGLNRPQGLAFDAHGNLYVANFGDNTIEKFDSAGNPTLFASTGLSGPYGLAFDNAGNLYAANGQGNSIVKFDSSGNASVFANSGMSSPAGLAFDKLGYLYVANAGFNNIVKFDSSGNGSVFANSGLNNPIGIAFDRAGYLYAVNAYGASSIEKFDRRGNGTLFASSAGLNQPFMIAIVPGASSPVQAEYSPPSVGLVAWWRGDGNADDSAGSHNGTLQGGMGFTTGMFGQAFAGGSNKRVLVPDSPDFELTTSVSIGAWVNIQANGYTVLLRGDDRPGLDPYALSMDGANNMGFQITDATGAAKSIFAPIPFNVWVQVTATLDDSTGDMRLYFNGNLVAEAFTTIRPFGALDPTQNPGIGIGNTPTYDFPFMGAIDEVVLYQRALSPSEVMSLVTPKR